MQVSVDTLDEGFTRVKQLAHGIVTMIAGNLLTHPLPQPFNGVEVGTVSGQRHQSKAQMSCGFLNDVGSMPGRTIPNNDNRTGDLAQPISQPLEETNRRFLVAVILVPDEALSSIEVISAEPIDAMGQGRRSVRTPRHFPDRSPGIAQIHFAMEVGLVQVQQDDFFSAYLFIQLVNGPDKAGSLLRIGLFEQLLALFPGQPLLFQERAQRSAVRFTWQQRDESSLSPGPRQ